MACCLMVPSHYLNQCWLTLFKSSHFSGNHMRAISQEIPQPSNTKNKISLKFTYLKFLTNLPRASELRNQFHDTYLLDGSAWVSFDTLGAFKYLEFQTMWPIIKNFLCYYPLLEIPTGSPVRSRQLWKRTGKFLLIWDSRHEDLQLFGLNFKHCYYHKTELDANNQQIHLT